MATKISTLLPDDREELLCYIREITDLDAFEINVGAATRHAVHMLTKVAAHGPNADKRGWAERTLAALAEDGMRGHVDNVIKETRTIIRKPATTNTVPLTVPARVGVRTKGAPAYQQRLWYELTWEDFGQWLDALERQQARQESKLAAFRQVATLHAKYPDTVTPGDALRLEGLDPSEIELAA